MAVHPRIEFPFGAPPPGARDRVLQLLGTEAETLFHGGDLPALEAVLADIDRNGFADGLVLGDLVGYGPHPEPTLRTVRRRGFAVLLGNHDYGVAHGGFAKGFSATGRQVAEWTREWLAALPTTLEGEGWMTVHGAPADKSRLLAYVYRMTYEANLDYLEQKGIPLCFHGHTHVEGTWYRAESEDGFADDASQSLDRCRYALVCPGSVGQPRGRQGSAARYAVLYPAERRVELRPSPTMCSAPWTTCCASGCRRSWPGGWRRGSDGLDRRGVGQRRGVHRLRRTAAVGQDRDPEGPGPGVGRPGWRSRTCWRR